jgi:hypothetical protein
MLYNGEGEGGANAVRKSMGYAIIEKFLLRPKAKNFYIPFKINNTYS